VFRYATSLDYQPTCFLFRSCDTTTECGEECDYSLSGPVTPAYPGVCCTEFTPGPVCEVNFNNVLYLGLEVPDAMPCQKLCQGLTSCRYFLHHELTQRCFLLANCDSLTTCDSCWSGPQYPDIGICLARPQAAVLLGGSGGEKVESWPCKLEIPGAHPTITLVRDRLVVTGGGDVYPWHALSSVEIFREDETSWELAPWSLSSPRLAHCAVAVSHVEIIIVGGINGTNAKSLNLVEKYNIYNGQAEVLPQLPTAIFGAACTLWGNKFIVSGGYNAGTLDNSVNMLDLHSSTWPSLPPLNDKKGGHTMGIVNDFLTVFGGGERLEASIEVLNETIWQMEQLVDKRRWHAMIQLPCPNQPTNDKLMRRHH